MRTTIDLPDELYRAVKARAALEGVSMRDYMTEALRARRPDTAAKARPVRRKSPFPLIRLKHTKALDLSGFNFDDLLT
jgi:hypothetical protein